VPQVCHSDDATVHGTGGCTTQPLGDPYIIVDAIRQDLLFAAPNIAIFGYAQWLESGTPCEGEDEAWSDLLWPYTRAVLSTVPETSEMPCLEKT
jgi:hypothetical protein